MKKKPNATHLRAFGIVVRRVQSVGPDGDMQVRLDVGGSAADPEMHIYCSGKDPVSRSQVGEDLRNGKSRGRFRGAVIRNVKSEGWRGETQVRLDVGGNRKKPQFMVFVAADHPFAMLETGDKFSV